MDEDKVLMLMNDVLENLRHEKPEDHSEMARRYAVTITEMEKVLAYYELFVVDQRFVVE